MASLKNRRGSWYARVLWYVDDKQKEKQIPLRTSSKVTARERISIVNKYESDIKLEINFDFPWLSEGSTTKVKRFTLQDATDLWIKKRKGKMRASTIETNETSLSYFADCLGNAIPLKTIENNHIERFIDYLNGRGLSITSINIHLRTIKAMLRHYYKIGKLMKIPLIEQISQNKTEPIYITDEEFHRIMNVEWLGDFYKRVFLLYR